MKSILKRNRVLAVIALIGLLASLVPLISRVQAEESNKYYDIVLDYNSMRSMARQSSQSEDEWLDLFKSLGVDKVALSEASALNLHDNAAIPVHAMTVKKAAESYGWEDQYPAEVAQWLRESTDVSDAIIWTETAASYEWILNAFEARFEDFEAKTYLEGEHGFIFIQQQKNGMKGEKLLTCASASGRTRWSWFAAPRLPDHPALCDGTEHERHEICRGLYRSAQALQRAVLYEQRRRARRL